MKVESVVNRIIERTKHDIDAFNQLEKTIDDVETTLRGDATNLDTVDELLRVARENIKTIRASIMTGLGKLREEEIDEILSRYRHSATHIYNLLDAYARYDPLYLQQAMETADDDTRKDAIAALPEEVKAEYRKLLE